MTIWSILTYFHNSFQLDTHLLCRDETPSVEVFQYYHHQKNYKLELKNVLQRALLNFNGLLKREKLQDCVPISTLLYFFPPY